MQTKNCLLPNGGYCKWLLGEVNDIGSFFIPANPMSADPGDIMTNYAQHLSLDEVSGVITIKRPFDFERKQTLSIHLMCQIYDKLSDSMIPIYSASSRLTLRVKDVDDNVPLIRVRGQDAVQLREQTYRLEKFDGVGILFLQGYERVHRTSSWRW